MLIRSLVLAGLLAVLPAAARADDLRLHRGHVPDHGFVRPTVGVSVHVHRDGCCRRLPERWETRVERVVLPGHLVERVVPAEFAVRWSPRLCAYVRVLVSPRRVVREWIPARVELRRRRVLVPARWICD